jgi:hypothetical protein
MAWPAAWPSAPVQARAAAKTLYWCAWLANALIWQPVMLSTTANPTDGLDSPAMPVASPGNLLIQRSIAASGR